MKNKKFYYCKGEIEGGKKCTNQCEFCEVYYKPLEDNMGEEELITIEKEKLDTLLKYFKQVCSMCDELNISEYEEMDNELSEKKKWLKNNFQ